MISGQQLGDEVLDLGKSIGLFSDDGNLDTTWFQQPLDRLESILTNQPDHSQRDALLSLLDALLPPAQLNGIPDGEKWHPLLGDQPRGNVYLTVKADSSGVAFGAAGDFSSTGAADPKANLRIHLPLIRSGASITAVAGTTDGPLKLDFRVELGWQRPAQTIGLAAVSVSAVVSFLPPENATANLVVTLEKLQLGEETPKDTVLDPANLGTEAINLVIGLIRQNLSQIAGPAGEVAAVVNHLLPLLGFSDAAIPPFPFEQIAQSPSALQGWFNSLIQGAGTPPISAWLGHLVGLLGAADLTVDGSGTSSDPWRAHVLTFGPDNASSLDVTLAAATGTSFTSLLIGVEAVVQPGGADPVARVSAQATLASIPLAGTAPATVLPAASVTMRAPGNSGAPPLVANANITVGSIRAGLNWDGSNLQPLLELDTVTLAGAGYARIDLTNADSVVAAVSKTVTDAIAQALGNGVGAHLAALIGLVKPAGDPGSPRGVNLADLVSNPARAIAAFHRSVLLDATHNWSFMLAEAAGLAGLGGAVSGTGTRSDPWNVALAAAGPLTLELAAWNSQQSGNAADPQQLRLGLRLAAASDPLKFEWLAELLAFDLPQSGDGSASLMAGQHASFSVQPIPPVPEVAGIALTVDSFSASMDWVPGGSMTWHAGINNVSLTAGGTTVMLGSIGFPAAASFDISDPAATAASLGISVPNLELLVRTLVARAAFAWGGVPGFTITGLLGIHNGLPGFQADWAVLGDPAAPGSLLSDPFGAVRNWLGHVAVDTSADGSAFLLSALNWLRLLLSNSLPDSLPDPSGFSFDLPVQGPGTYADPWTLPLISGAASNAEALTWLEPAGPPPSWAASLAAVAAAVADSSSLLNVAKSLGSFLPDLRDALALLDAGTVASSLDGLAAYFAASDGVVPVTSQIPTGGNWTAGTPVNAAHHLQPKDPSAISQILAQVDNLAGGSAGARAVLLIGPSFTDHTSWQDLLSSPNRHGSTDPAAHFNLRVPGVDPAAIDLGTVSAAVDYYTADLFDDGSGNLTSLVGQIARLVGRINQLRPGVPVTLVAHSTAGVPARAFTAANPTLVQGLITLASPHAGAPLPFLADSDVAEAARLLAALRPGLATSSPIRDALDHVSQALDGYIPAASAGALPTPAPYPVGSFNFASGPATDTGGKPAFALGGPLAGSLFDELKGALGNLVTSAAHPASPPPAPTHIGFGVRSRLSLPSPHPTEVAVDGWVRADLFRVKLQAGAAEPARPAHALVLRVKLSRPGDWLVGAASSFANLGAPPVDVRVRWAELGSDIQLGGSGGVQVIPQLALHQVSYRGPMSSVATLTDAAAQALLGAVLHSIASPAPRVGSPVDVLLNALELLGIAVPDPHGGVGISADAFTAIATDPVSYLAPRLETALNNTSGLLGLVSVGDSQWSMSVSGLPLEVYLSHSKQDSSWTAGMRTTPAGDGGLSLASNTSLSFDGSLYLPDFRPALDATFSMGALGLTWSQSQSRLTLQAPPWLAPLMLVPAPDSATLKAALNDALPRLIFSSVASALFGALLGPDFQIGPIDSFFSASGNSARNSPALGNGSTLDSAKLTAMLQAINQAAGFPAGPGLTLPGGFQITASGAGTDVDPVSLMLATTASIGGAVSIQAGVVFDTLMHVSPKGTLTLTIAGLPKAGILAWDSITVAFGASTSGLTLSVTPQPGTVIQILPTFSGLGALAQNLEALLPRALQDLVDALSIPGPPPALLTASLEVATALGIYDSVGKFAVHADKLKALTDGNWTAALGLSSATQGQVATAIAGLFSGVSPLSGTVPGTVSASSQAVTWKLPLAGADAGTLTVSLGWDGSGPTATLGLTAFKLGNGALTADVAAGYGSGQVQFSTALGLSLASSLGLDVAPKFAAGLSAGSFSVKLLPLASGSGDGPLTVTLAPSPSVQLDAGGAVQLAENLLLPLVSDLVLKAATAELTSPVWPGASKTVEDVLVSANLIVKGATPDKDKLKTPLPDIATLVANVIAAFTSGVSVPVTDSLNLALVDDGGQLGIRLSGHQNFSVGSFDLSMRFGAPSEWGSGTDDGVTLYLLKQNGSITFKPVLDVAGLGLGITGNADAPLINTPDFRLGGLRGYVFFRSELGGALFSAFGGGIELDSLGLPLGQATGGNVGGNNPVAASLLKSDSGSGGDPHPVNPGADVSAWYIQAPHGNGQFNVQIGDKPGDALWIPVHAGFGPIYIDQIGVELDSQIPSAALLIDGSVKVDGLVAQADELEVTIPLRSLASPGDWSLDLKGLAVAFSAPGVTIAGGLLKSDGPPVEYDGMLLIQITELGFVAVGAYSTPSDAQGGYTSLFVFAGVFVVVGIPPIIEVDAFGLGVGYNRELIVPDDVNQVPNFILVAALDEGGAFANDPMGELMQIRSSMPARRGSFWLAVGLRGSSFVIVHVTAVVYVALDRGVEVGILGVARMALPGDDTALVNIELALKARFSTAEGILSIQAQLTDNSWLLSPDCQLTGGFAYFMWFPKSQFVLSIGGYNPSFAKPPEFPDVPRLGYHWSLLGAINIKGESYFALTNTCVMAGARFEATYGPDWIQVWFTAYSDFLLSWDPFYYNVSLGISVGARFSIDICCPFVGCATIDISVSIGATLVVAGPPLHGEVTVDLDVASVTVAFGPNANPQPPYITDWGVFATKYVYGGDPNGSAVATHLLTGLVPPEPAGGQPSPGTLDQPWKMTSEFSFQTESHMPGMEYTDFISGHVGPLNDVRQIDVNPMNVQTVTSHHSIVLDGWDDQTNTWVTVSPSAGDERFRVSADHFRINPVIGQVSEATWSYIDPTNVPAAARTVPALTGIGIEGFAVTEGQSALIPISKLVDYGDSRPLPFALDINVVLLKSFGAAADALALLTAGASSGTTVSAASTLLAGGGFFSQARAASGLPASGLEPLAVYALSQRRSSPPQLAPITTGLTMKPVGLAAPPAINRVAPVPVITLDQPRLSAVLQGHPQPVTDAPAPLRTSVLKVAPANAVRLAAPVLDTVAGASLQRLPAPNAARPTAVASTSRTLRTLESGWSPGAARIKAMQKAESDFVSAGVTLAAGVTHVWEIPQSAVAATVDTLRALAATGPSGVRVTFLTRGGRALADEELLPQKETHVAIPIGAAMVAVTCLGNIPPGETAPAAGFGALAGIAAPGGKTAVTGWQTGNVMPQVGATTLLGRGALLTLPQIHGPSRGRQQTSQAMVKVSDALVDQLGVETWLPTSTGVVMVVLDQQDPTAASDGDLSIAVEGATVVTPPLRAGGGRRKALLYNVTDRVANADHLVVGVASGSGWRLAGVVGLPGQAQEWAVSMNGGVPEHLVPDGPLTPDGQVNVRLIQVPVGGVA